MSVKPHLTTSLQQRLVLTPQMRQRIELLAMTKLELSDMVTTEMSANPVLEEVAPGDGPDEHTTIADDIAAIDATTADYTGAGGANAPVDRQAATSDFTTSAETATANAVEAPISGDLDDNTGVLDATLEEIAAMGPWPMETVERALQIVQRLDPVGVAARDVRESLLIQLDARGLGDTLAARMVRDHFESLQTHKLPELAKTLGVPLEQVIAEMEIVKQLDPKPGRKYSAEEAQPVVPEVTIEKVGDSYVIRFEDEGMPHLRINRTYRQMMESKDATKETRDYIKERFRSAVDLLKNSEHRRQTIYRV